MEKLIKVMDYLGLLDQQEQRSDPEKPLIGIGTSTWLRCWFWTERFLERFGRQQLEMAHVRVTDGSVILSVDTSPHGRGHRPFSPRLPQSWRA